MKKICSFLCALILGVFFTSPLYAYETTDQKALRLSDTMGLYLITFEFGHEDHDVYIPVLAKRQSELQRGALSYEVIDDEGEIARGAAAGIVLANLPIVNGMYQIPKGTSASFTLFTLFTKSDNEVGTEFTLNVTGLPFTFDAETELQLNPSELQHYMTPALDFDVKPFTVSGVDVYYKSTGTSGATTLTSDNSLVTVHSSDE